MSPRTKQSSMTKSSNSERPSRRSASQYMPRNNPGTAFVPLTSYTGDMSYPSRSRSATLRSDDSLVWNGTFSGHLPTHDDTHLDSLHMDTMAMSDNSFMLPVMPGADCYSTSSFDRLSQGPMSQTLTEPLLNSPYQDVMMADNALNTSPLSMEFSGYGQQSHHTWRHGQLSPPADIFHPDLNEYSPDSACDVSFQTLPEAAISGAFPYDRTSNRSVCDTESSRSTADSSHSSSKLGHPRPLRCASEKNILVQTTLAPQDIHYSRSDRADKVKARNDPRYEVSPEKDGYYHCPMLDEGSCNHKPTKQKCIYAKYLDSHLKPYACTHGEKGSECDGARFSSNACLFRHEREAHGMHNHGLNPYLCLFPGCERSRQGNGFPRRWNQRDHMKRVHDWEEPESSGYDHTERHGSTESSKRRKSGHSHTVPMKRSTSSHAKAQAATYAHGSQHPTNSSRYTVHNEKQMHATLMAYPMHFDDLHFSQVSPYSQQSATSEAYSNPYLVAY